MTDEWAGRLAVCIISGLGIWYTIRDIRNAERKEREISEALDIANGKPKGPEDDEEWLNSLRDDPDGK